MPQVVARINEDHEQWLKDYFRTKSAGAEFILPWAVDIFFRKIATIKEEFSSTELKALINMYKDIHLTPEQTRLSYLLLRVSENYTKESLYKMYGLSYKSLDTKLKKLDDIHAASLIIWASAFWVSKYSQKNIDHYISEH